MATTKNNTEVTENAAVSEAKSDRIDLTIPPVKSTDEENFIYVNLNGKGYKVKKGMTVNMPRAVAEVIMNSIEAEREAVENKRKMLDAKEVLI